MSDTPKDSKKVAFIPDEAIKTSEQARKKSTQPSPGKPDKYGEDKISPDQPSNDEVKRQVPDTNIKGG